MRDGTQKIDRHTCKRLGVEPSILRNAEKVESAATERTRFSKLLTQPRLRCGPSAISWGVSIDRNHVSSNLPFRKNPVATLEAVRLPLFAAARRHPEPRYLGSASSQFECFRRPPGPMRLKWGLRRKQPLRLQTQFASTWFYPGFEDFSVRRVSHFSAWARYRERT